MFIRLTQRIIVFHLYPLNKSSLFVIPAEFADWVDDSIHLPERHSIHLLVQFVEVRTDLFVIIRTVFVRGTLAQSE